MIDQDQLFEPLRESLATGHATAPLELVTLLARHLCGQSPSEPVEVALAQALDADPALVSGLMVALLRCQQRHLELIIPQFTALAVEQQVTSLQQLFQRYGHLQQRWMALVQRHYDEEIGALTQAVEQEKAKVIVERTKTRWLRDGQIKLFNYFRELQVAGVATVSDVTDEHVVVLLSPKLGRVFAAGENKRFAYTPAPSEPGLSLRLIFQDRRADQVTLRVGGVAEHLQERRRHLRMSVREPPPMAVEQRGRAVGEARVMDFSEGGLGLRFPQAVALGGGDEIVCRGTLRAHQRRARIAAPATVRWVHVSEGTTHMGVELRPSPQEKDELLALIREYEQRVIQDLRLLEVPEALRD